MTDDATRLENRLKMKAWRDARKAKGLPYRKPLTEEAKRRNAENAVKRRATRVAAGLPIDPWYEANKEARKISIAEWREKNPEKVREMLVRAQRVKRATPNGILNNRMWSALNQGLRRNLPKPRFPGKYNVILGYEWRDLRAHIEAQFSEEMTWANRGSVWELDHIKPLRLFQYVSLEDPLFCEAWALTNLRPLLREENTAKGDKYSD